MSLYIIQMISSDGAYFPEQPIIKSAKLAAQELMQWDGFERFLKQSPSFINGDGEDVSAEVAESYVDQYFTDDFVGPLPEWVEQHAGLYAEDKREEYERDLAEFQTEMKHLNSDYYGSRL